MPSLMVKVSGEIGTIWSLGSRGGDGVGGDMERDDAEEDELDDMVSTAPNMSMLIL